MPAVLIRQLENLQKVMTLVTTPDQRETLLQHARLVLETGDQSVPQAADRHDIQVAYDTLVGVSNDIWEG